VGAEVHVAKARVLLLPCAEALHGADFVHEVVAGLDVPGPGDDDGTFKAGAYAVASGPIASPYMIECIFTLDYEIYGAGTGSLGELVYEPTRQLAKVFQHHGARFVVFVEAVELARIEEGGADPMSGSVKEQVRNLDRAGFEIGLHLHPWWYNAHRQGVNWILDHNEYNLCTLPAARISVIVSDSIRYLQRLVGRSDFTPLSFRAGNWSSISRR